MVKSFWENHKNIQYIISNSLHVSMFNKNHKIQSLFKFNGVPMKSPKLGINGYPKEQIK